MANRDATQGLLAAANKTLAAAAKICASGKTLFDFYKNLAREDAVQYFILGWKEVTAAIAALAVALLLSMVAFSYRQTVYAYPHGGGSYNVSRQNLGQMAGLIAAAALLIDYVMTVAVSIAAGSFAVTSALNAAGVNITAITATLPAFLNLNVILSLIFIGLITLGNLRGIRESGSIFAIPTYLFI